MEGSIVWEPHDCPVPVKNLYKEGTIWKCDHCNDHWELRNVSTVRHWERVLRWKYESRSH